MSSWRLMIMAVVGVFSSANANVLFVDADNCPGPGSGTPGDPYCSIQDAIDAALDLDEIVVAPGTYFETINFLGKAITLWSSNGQDVTTIDAQFTGSVVTCDTGEGSDTVLEGFTITGGSGTDFGGFLVGGGMYNDNNSSPTVTDCTFSDNTGFLTAGGGMFNFNNSNPTVSGCTFSGNSADFGGGMGNCDSSPTVTDCTFSGNPSTHWGGGMYNGNHSNATVTNCTFSENTADAVGSSGGGMLNFASDPTVTNCLFIRNVAQGGGGMDNRQQSMPVVTDCTFSDNTVVFKGGGMYNFAGGSPTVINCTFVGNSAGTNGGGMYNTSSPTVINCIFSVNFAAVDGGGMFNSFTSPMVANCTFSGNTADANGGGIKIEGGMPTVINCTFALNSAANGQALAFDSLNQKNPSDFTMTNCIVWNSGDGIWNNDGSTLAIGYSDVAGGWPGIGNINADPLFVDPATGDFHLLPGSPCIDAANNIAVPPEVTADLDGNPRFVDDAYVVDTGNGDPPIVDMGAYELCLWDCGGDHDGNVGIVDFLGLLSQWDQVGTTCDFGLGNPGVGVNEFLDVLANWGPCP